jgi:hypothetical protein
VRAVDLFAGWGGLERFPRGKRRAILVTAFGETLSVSGWSAKKAIDVVVLLKRLQHGWHVETALTAPPQSKNASTWSPPIDPDLLRYLYERGATQAELAAELKTTSKVIQVALRRLGIRCRKAAKRDQRGAKNSSWKGGRIVDGAGYILVLARDHHRANCRGYVREHVLVMEEKLGRRLVWFGASDPRTEIVHHKNRDKKNNHPDNLDIESFASHAEEHRDPKTGRLGA